MIKQLSALLCFYLCLVSGGAFAADELQLNETTPSVQNLQPYGVMTKQNKNSQLEDVQRLPSSAWQKLNDISEGTLGNEAYWYQFKITNTSNLAKRKLLVLGAPNIDFIEIHHIIDGVEQPQIVMGDELPFAQRKIKNNVFVYPVLFQPNEHHELWIKQHTKNYTFIPFELYDQDAYLSELDDSSMFYGLMLGLLLTAVFYGILVSVVLRVIGHLYFSGFALAVAVFISSIYGFGYQYFWPNSPFIQAIIVPFTAPVAMAFSALFTNAVLNLRKENARLSVICRLVAAALFVFSLLTPMLEFNVASYVALFLLFISGLTLLCISAIKAAQGSLLALVYMISWICCSAAILTSILSFLDFITIACVSHLPLILGLFFEVFFMAIVIVIRYDEEFKEKLVIQKNALRQAENIRKERERLLELESNKNVQIEKLVQQRTEELKQTLEELNQANRRLAEQATKDGLTGLGNRACFDQNLIKEGRVSRRYKTSLAILMIDIDKFKNINDTHGHMAGDDVLRQVAQLIYEQIRRPSDDVSRYGGEEFVVTLPNTDKPGALFIAEKIRHAISLVTIEWDGTVIPVTASIGVSVDIIGSDSHIMQLLEQADAALYQAKESGRNRVCFYEN